MSGETSSLKIYLNQISEFPLLEKEDELKICGEITCLRLKIRAFQNKEKKNPSSGISDNLAALNNELLQYKNKMINSNLRLVVSIAKKYRHFGFSLSDLINEGNIGLITAVDKFDYKKGCRFATYGAYWIKQSITKAIEDKGLDIRLPNYVHKFKYKCFKASQQLTAELGRVPAEEEISEYLNIPLSKVSNIISLSRSISLETGAEEDSIARLAYFVKDDSYLDPFETTCNKIIKENVYGLLTKLTVKERKIIKLRYGLSGNKPFTLDETGKSLNLSRERVRQIQDKALRKLRKLHGYAMAG